MDPNSPKPRKVRASARPHRGKKNPAFGEALKRAWQDPEKRARMLAGIKGGGNRMGVPDGMTRAQVAPLWAKAKQLSERFIAIMEDAGKVERTPTPGSKEEMGKQALAEAFTYGVGPHTDAKTKSAYLKLVLDFTMAKPESKSKLTLDRSEEWLAALEADMKNGSPSDTSSAS